MRRASPQTVAVLEALAGRPAVWRYGYELGREVALGPPAAAPAGSTREAGRRDCEEVAAMTGQKVRDVMTPEVVVVAPDCGFKHIVDVLADFRVSAVPVVEDGTLVGIVSEADLLHKVEFSDGAQPPRHF